jgi:hypothetical protein
MGLHFLKLLAAHALFRLCGERICSGTDGIRTGMLKDLISAHNHQTGRSCGDRPKRAML